MAARRKRKSWKGCHCPRGSRRISTRGHGRGWVCKATSSGKRRLARGRLKSFGKYVYPFVKATCG